MTQLPRWLAALGIVTAAGGCDNVSWGGIEVSLRGPGVEAPRPTTAQADSAPRLESSLSLGPLLYVTSRTEGTGVLFPIGELGPEGLRPVFGGEEGEEVARRVLRERMRPGTEFVLVDQGLRVGTVTLGTDEVEVSRESCLPRPRARGWLELVPEAAELERFLALEKDRVTSPKFGFRGIVPARYEHRVASLALAAEAIQEAGAPWPAVLREARQEIHLLPLDGGSIPWIMATFVYQDAAQVGPPGGAGAYSLLVLGEPQADGWRLAYSGYRPAATRGKGVPRFFATFDWDQDGQMEILFEILGEQDRWWQALGRVQGVWQTIFEDVCGAPVRRP